MPGFRMGLTELAGVTNAVRAGTEPPDGQFGPYEPWVRPLVLARQGRFEDAMKALEAFADPPQDLMLEVSWFLIGVAAIETGNRDAGRRAYAALLPAADERAGGSGAVDLGAISDLLDQLRQFCTTNDQH